MQQYADIYLLLNYSTCFGHPSRPSSGVHKTVVVASVTDRTVWGASLMHGPINLSLEGSFETSGSDCPVVLLHIL